MSITSLGAMSITSLGAMSITSLGAMSITSLGAMSITDSRTLVQCGGFDFFDGSEVCELLGAFLRSDPTRKGHHQGIDLAISWWWPTYVDEYNG